MRTLIAVLTLCVLLFPLACEPAQDGGGYEATDEAISPEIQPDAGELTDPTDAPAEEGAEPGEGAADDADMEQSGEEPQAAAPTTIEDFIAAFKTAYDQNDAAAMGALHYWEGTPDSLRANKLQMMANPKGMTAESIEFVELEPGHEGEYKVVTGGKTYLPNLPVVGSLKYEMVYDAGTDTWSTNTEQPVGKKDGGYYFTGVELADAEQSG